MALTKKEKERLKKENEAQDELVRKANEEFAERLKEVKGDKGNPTGS